MQQFKFLTMSGIIVRIEVEVVEESGAGKIVGQIVARLGGVSRKFSNSTNN